MVRTREAIKAEIAAVQKAIEVDYDLIGSLKERLFWLETELGPEEFTEAQRRVTEPPFLGELD